MPVCERGNTESRTRTRAVCWKRVRSIDRSVATWRTFDTAMSPSPFRATTTLLIVSGSDVPADRTVNLRIRIRIWIKYD